MTIAYSMLNVTATLDGRRVVGLMDGDNAIQVAPGVDAGTMLVGADGTYIFSQTADRSATITLRLKHNSPTHRQLIEKWRAQRAGRLVGFVFDLVDNASNEGGTAADCFIQTPSDDMKGNEATVREWVLVSGDWTPNITDLD